MNKNKCIHVGYVDETLNHNSSMEMLLNEFITDIFYNYLCANKIKDCQIDGNNASIAKLDILYDFIHIANTALKKLESYGLWPYKKFVQFYNDGKLTILPINLSEIINTNFNLVYNAAGVNELFDLYKAISYAEFMDHRRPKDGYFYFYCTDK